MSSLTAQEIDVYEIERVFRAAAARYEGVIIPGDPSLAMATALKEWFEARSIPAAPALTEEERRLVEDMRAHAERWPLSERPTQGLIAIIDRLSGDTTNV